MSTYVSAIFITDADCKIAIESPQGTQQVDVSLPDEPSPQDLAAAIADRISLIPHQRSIVLAIPSVWCVSATVDLPARRSRGWQKSAMYELEHKIPFAIEQVVGDFILSTSQALGVCVEVDRLSTLIEALEKQGIAIGAICPSSLLALQHLLSYQSATQADILLLREGELTNIFLLQRGELIAWHVAPSAPDVLLTRLKILIARAQAGSSHRQQSLSSQQKTNSTLRMVGYQLDPALQLSLQSLSGVVLHDFPSDAGPPQGLSHFAGLQAALISRGKRMPLVNFRRDQLASTAGNRQLRRPAAAAAAGLILAMLAWGGAWLWAAHRYELHTAALQQQQEQLYCRLMPGQPVPRLITRQLESYYNSLSAGSLQTPLHIHSPLNLLAYALRSLPLDVPFALSSIHVDETSFELEGQAVSQDAVSRISVAIQEMGQLHIDPLQTQVLPNQAVSFFISGSVTQAAGSGSFVQAARVSQFSQPHQVALSQGTKQ